MIYASMRKFLVSSLTVSVRRKLTAEGAEQNTRTLRSLRLGSESCFSLWLRVLLPVLAVDGADLRR